MARFVSPIPLNLAVGESLALSEGESRHATRVLRLRQGGLIDLLDGRGRMARCRLVGVDAKVATAEVLEIENFPRPDLQITVFQAAIKPKGMEWAIQKLAELGVRQIVPVVTQNCEVRFAAKAAEEKRQKWVRSTVETLKQCGGPWLTEVHEIQTLDQALVAANEHYHLQFVADLEFGRQRLRLESSDLERRPLRVALWIGPEGDFTSGEIEQIRANGARSITLGPTTLRSESAAVVAVAGLAHEYDRVPDPI